MDQRTHIILHDARVYNTHTWRDKHGAVVPSSEFSGISYRSICKISVACFIVRKPTKILRYLQSHSIHRHSFLAHMLNLIITMSVIDQLRADAFNAYAFHIADMPANIFHTYRVPVHVQWLHSKHCLTSSIDTEIWPSDWLEEMLIFKNERQFTSRFFDFSHFTFHLEWNMVSRFITTTHRL